MATNESFREGAVKYEKDSKGEWRFSIIARNGEPLDQSEGYTLLSDAKRGAEALKRALNIEEVDE